MSSDKIRLQSHQSSKVTDVVHRDESALNEATKFLSVHSRAGQIVIVPTAVNRATIESSKVRAPLNVTETDDSKASESESQSENIPNSYGLYGIDCLIGCVIVAPMVVAHWKSIWQLMDYHESTFTGWRCYGVGTSLNALLVVARQPLHRRLQAVHEAVNHHGSRGLGSRIYLRAIRTAYIYSFSLACNCQWRGLWIILNHWFASDDLLPGLAVACLTCAVLGNVVLLRCTRNLLSPPVHIHIDSAQFVFCFPTMFRQNTRDWTLYILDCAFSVGVVGSLVVFVWRGAWALLDLYLFPENRENSAIGSLVIGYALVSLAFGAQPWARSGCARLKGLARLLLADGFILLSFFGTVNVWRGIWNALDLYLLPQALETSCWITHLGCFLFLVLLNCSNSVLVRGVYIDGEEQGGNCVDLPCHYLRIIFQEQGQKKEAHRANLMVATAAKEPNSKEAENGALLTTNIQRHPPESHV